MRNNHRAAVPRAGVAQLPVDIGVCQLDRLKRVSITTETAAGQGEGRPGGDDTTG